MRPLISASLITLSLFVSCGLSDTAYAQSYPEKLIKIIVPFGPGGPNDVSARVVAQGLQSAFGQNVIVENRAGAGGATGTRAAARADPDGYTLLLGSSATLAVVPAVYKNPGFDPNKSFTAVARVSESCLILIVHPKFSVSTIQELIAYAKANPGKLNYGSAGLGNQTHLVWEMFKLSAGADIVHVPYKSAAEMVTAVLSEQVQMAFADISILLPLIREGRLKALAITSAARRSELPDLPTVIESGFPDFLVSFWTGIVAPAGTPPEVVGKLNAKINESLKSRETRTALVNLGAEAKPDTPEGFAAFIAAEVQRWSALAKSAGISID